MVPHAFRTTRETRLVSSERCLRCPAELRCRRTRDGVAREWRAESSAAWVELEDGARPTPCAGRQRVRRPSPAHGGARQGTEGGRAWTLAKADPALRFFAREPGSTIRAAAEALGWTRSTTMRAVEFLEGAGVVVCEIGAPRGILIVRPVAPVEATTEAA